MGGGGGGGGAVVGHAIDRCIIPSSTTPNLLHHTHNCRSVYQTLKNNLEAGMMECHGDKNPYPLVLH